MKDRALENFIRNAQAGSLTKDEFRDFQRMLKWDRDFAERIAEILEQEDFDGQYRPHSPDETEPPPDSDLL